MPMQAWSLHSPLVVVSTIRPTTSRLRSRTLARIRSSLRRKISHWTKCRRNRRRFRQKKKARCYRVTTRIRVLRGGGGQFFQKSLKKKKSFFPQIVKGRDRNFADENFVHKFFGQKQIFTLRFHRKRPLYACDDLKKPNFLIKVWHGSCIY